MLLEFQRSFRDHLLGEAGAAMPPGPSALMAVYRDGVRAGLTGALEAAFPATAKLAGLANFRWAADAHVAAEPPREARLSRYGDGFPAHLAGLAAVGRVPWLVDLARLEWAMVEAYFAADADPLDVTALAPVPPAAVQHLRLVPHPSLRLVASPHPILALREAALADRPGPTVDGPMVEPVDGPAERILVLRQGIEVVAWAVGQDEFRMLDRLARGLPLSEAARGVDLATLLALNIARGAFCRFSLGDAR